MLEIHVVWEADRGVWDSARHRSSVVRLLKAESVTVCRRTRCFCADSEKRGCCSAQEMLL